MERRFIEREFSQLRLEERADHPVKIVGYAAVFYDGTKRTEFELWPGVVERIMPGAFDKAIASRDDVLSLFNHDANAILGRRSAGSLELRVDKVGLLYEVEPSDTVVAKDVVENIRAGNLAGSSFSFRITDEEWRKEDGVEIREVTGVTLFDTGPVTFPAYIATTSGLRGSTAGIGLTEARSSYEAWKNYLEAENRRRGAEIALDIDVLGL